MSILNKNKATALIVDDEMISRTISSKMVEAQGWSVDTAQNGDEALTLWQNNHYPLIITDCHMPIMDGFDLTKAIRHFEQTENTTPSIIVALTANTAAEELNDCTQAGMNDVLSKPINLAKLKTILTNCMTQAATEQAHTLPLDAAAHNTDNAQTPVDYAILDQIFPDRAKQTKVLQDLQSHVHDSYDDLQLQVKQANVAGVESTAHRMKGSCKMVGVNGIASICAEIENKAKSGSIAANLALSTLNESIRQFDAYLFQQLAQTTHGTSQLRAN